MNEVRWFNQQRMILNAHAGHNTPEYHKAISEIDRIIKKHESQGTLRTFIEKAQGITWWSKVKKWFRNLLNKITWWKK